MLKQWLVERQENPYPTRTEKKQLADSTGLTYIQICNWFANWRRKLKNTADGEGEQDQEEHPHHQQRNWKHLIRTYNEHAKGNVEQLPVSEDEGTFLSGDSSEGETESQSTGKGEIDCNNNSSRSTDLRVEAPQMTSGEDLVGESPTESLGSQRKKYKKFMMEKYFQDERSSSLSSSNDTTADPQPQLLKWIESTAKFTADKTNYSAWAMEKMSRGKVAVTKSHQAVSSIRYKELEAAEILAHLSAS